MAERKWTESQQDAISARRGTVLVAAAAGSGKTAVLVERAAERLTDSENPTPADRLLIVTFTKAAAAEMRARLEKRLSDMLREKPADPLLRRQSILLSQAHIGTVDSFCSNIVREFFHLLEISPDFKIVSDKQEEELINSSLNEVLSAAFDAGISSELADAFAGERDDRRLIQMILSLYRFMQSHPFPEKWLEEKVRLYFSGDCSLWESVILKYVSETAEYCENLLASAIERSKEDEKLFSAFAPAMEKDKEFCSRLKEAAQNGSWDEAVELRSAFSLARRGILKGMKDNPLLEQLDACRQEVKKCIGELQKCLAVSSEKNVEELRASAPLIKSLADMTLAFSEKYSEKKREKNLLDYSDLEHFAIKLLLDEGGNPTQTAKELSERFDEIMIDEYQDINEVQDSIFRALSKNSKNLFKVGDVKQSIYGFRRAMPEIFLRCKKSYEKYDRESDGYPATIALDRNFRSRKEVTDSINFVFSLLMSEAAGDIDYTGDERLICGADYAEKPNCETELQFIERGEAPAEVAEAQWIAKRIKEMIAEGFTVSDHGAERPADYGDFCILLRSANKYAHPYAKELQKYGVPAKASISGGFFAAAEIQVMLSLLRVIDNPNQDIPLLATLMSPIYGFTADDAARLREDSRDVSVYMSLLRAAETDERCAGIIKEIGELRNIAATMPSDAFLTMLYAGTGYADMVLAMPEGEARLANLHLLQKYAREYESSGYYGISGFVRFMDRLQQNGSDMQAAEVEDKSSSAVSVMSIHKSKGLEFPVCIVAGCGRGFVSDKSDDVLLHPELGLGVKLRDERRSARFTTTVREAIVLETGRSAAAEELRILYVAMTRAKEKLIMVSSYSGNKLEQSIEKLGMEITEKGVTPYSVRKAKNPSQWLLLCALCHPDGGELRKTAGLPVSVVRREDAAAWKIGISAYAEEEAPEQEIKEPEKPDLQLLERLKQQIAFVYPHSESLGVPAKVSASKLAAEQSGSREVNLARPAWLGEKGMTPAERGIALHEFMQFADFHSAAEDPEKELQRLVEKAFLSKEQAEAVDIHRVRAFFKSELGKRVLASDDVQKERRFTAVIPAKMAERNLLPEAENESVILQGAVDCTFVENGRLHIIDFKTDRVDDVEELWELYGVQIRLYAYAMEEVSGMEVVDLSLYSTWLSRAGTKKYRQLQCKDK